MKVNAWRPTRLQSRLTLWYVGVLAVLLLVYAALVFSFQYAVLSRQIVHDEIQDVETVEGLLYFDKTGALHLRQDYYSRPQSHLLIDRLMEVRSATGEVLYRSPTLGLRSLGGSVLPDEGLTGFDQRLVRLDDGSHAIVISHIHRMDGQPLLIRLGYSLAALRRRMYQFLLILLIAVPIALLIAATVGQSVARGALQPIDQMAREAAGITAHNLDNRLAVLNPSDELGMLASAFNCLLDRLHQSFVQLDRFTADAAHELRTPIAALRAIAEISLVKGQTPSDQKEALISILEEASSLNETIEGLLLLARAEATQAGKEQQVVPIGLLVQEVLAVLDVIIEDKRLTIVQEHPEHQGIGVWATRSLLRTALMNVLHNAIKFSPDGSRLVIDYQPESGIRAMLQLVVTDQGPGIEKGEHQKVFDRFFTSTSRNTASQSGTGLGLSVAALVIDRIGGAIRFDEAAAPGARCIITLPIAAEQK